MSALLLAVFLAGTPVLCPGQGVSVFHDPLAWQNPQLAQPSGGLISDEGGGYFRNLSYYYTARLNDGIAITLVLYRWTYGILGGWGLFVAALGPDGVPHVLDARFGEPTVEITAHRYRISFNGGTVEGSSAHHHIAVDREGFGCDLQIDNLLPPWRPGDGVVRLSAQDDIFVRMAVPVPWATVRGTVRFGEHRIAVSGQLYGDSSLAVLPMNRQNSPLYAFRAFSPQEVPGGERWFASMLLSYSDPAYGTVPIPTMILARGGKWVFTTKDFTLMPLGLQKDPSTGATYPTRMAVYAERHGYVLNGVFSNSRLVWLTDVFKELPPVLKAVAQAFLKRPVVYRFAGAFQGTVTDPDGQSHPLALSGQGEYIEIR